MARHAGGIESLDRAHELLRRAETANELRQAQAVFLPLVLGLSIEQTAQAIGRSPGVTCSMRTRFTRVVAGVEAPPRTKHQLRNRAAATMEREQKLLARVVGSSRTASPAIVPRLRALLEAEFGHGVALSSVYRLLQRHGWRRELPQQPGAEGTVPTQLERRRRPAPRWVCG